MPVLIKRLGDSAPRTRGVVSDNVVEIANAKEIKVTLFSLIDKVTFLYKNCTEITHCALIRIIKKKDL